MHELIASILLKGDLPQTVLAYGLLFICTIYVLVNSKPMLLMGLSQERQPFSSDQRTDD